MASNYFIHGNAVTVAERPGGGNVGSAGDLENINGGVNFREAANITFRGAGLTLR